MKSRTADKAKALEETKAAFRKAMSSPATRVRVIKEINRGNDTTVDDVKVLIMRNHGRVRYLK